MRFTIPFLVIALFFVFSCKKPVATTPGEYGWFEFVIPDLDTTENVVDLSFLNEEIAGESGFISVRDGHFIDGAGNRIRFFGTNLTFSSCFPEKETAVRIASRLRKQGMNIVRFHHLDMRVSPDGIWDESMESFDQDQLDKLDWLIYQLRQNGIYSNLNLHVSRTYPGVNYDLNQFNFGKSIDQFYRPYIEMQKEYARELLSHINPYTGNSYLEEPAVAFIEINNENSLLSNWRLLPQLKGDHKIALEAQWDNWQSSNPHYNVDDLFGIIEGYDSTATRFQKEMFWSFLVETEMSYAREMIGYVRNDLGAKALIADSQASYSGIAGIHREASYSDFIDMHAYWQHPRFPGQAWSRSDWYISNSSMVADKEAGTLTRFGKHRVNGMPLTISEYDHPAPSFYCAEMYPILNSVAAFQNWDGIYHFTFNGPWERGRISGFFSSAGHPLKQVFVPIGSLIFRQGLVKTGEKIVQLQIPEDNVLDELVNSGHLLRLHGSNMDYVWESAGAPAALTLMHPMEVVRSGEEIKLTEQVIEPEGKWVSETGELSWDNRDSVHSVYTIDADGVKGAVGYIGGKIIELGNVQITMDTTPFNWGAIVMASIDGQSIASSANILLVAAGRVENSEMGWNDEKTSVGTNWGDAPTMAEAIPAVLSLDNVDDFSVFSLDPSGNVEEEVPVNRRRMNHSFGIGAQYETLWYILTRDAPPSG